MRLVTNPELAPLPLAADAGATDHPVTQVKPPARTREGNLKSIKRNGVGIDTQIPFATARAFRHELLERRLISEGEPSHTQRAG